MYLTPDPIASSATVSSTPYVSSSVDLGVITENYILGGSLASTDAALGYPLGFSFEGSVDGTNFYPIPGGWSYTEGEGTMPTPFAETAVEEIGTVPARYIRATGQTNAGTMELTAHVALASSL